MAYRTNVYVMSKSLAVKKPRMVNFEVLRTLIMFFIVVWHSLVHGLNFAGMMSELPPASIIDWDSPVSVFNYLLTGYMSCITSVAVDCYVLITGYFMIRSDFKWKKLSQVWLQTAFYSFTIALIMLLTDNVDWGLGGLFFSAFPVYNGEYWFVVKYLALMALAPFLSILAQNLNQRTYQIGLVVLFILTSNLLPYFSYGNIYSGSSGLLLFIFLFYIGGYIRLYNPFASLKDSMGKYFLLGCLALLMINLIKDLSTWYIGGELAKYGMTVLGNHSYTLLLAVLLFLWAKHHTFKNTLIVRLMYKAAPFTFGVYLIHDNNHLRELMWENLNLPQYLNSYGLVFLLLGVSLIIFIVCIFLDYIRSYIFDILRLNEKFFMTLKGCIHFGFTKISDLISHRSPHCIE